MRCCFAQHSGGSVMSLSPNTESAQHTIHNEQNVGVDKSIRQAMKGFFKHTHRTVTLLGAFALVILGIVFFKPEIGEQLLSLSPFDADTVETADTASTNDDPQPLATLTVTPGLTKNNDIQPINSAAIKPAKLTQQQNRVVKWLSKRYRVSQDAIKMMASSAYTVGKELNVDPLLILAVISIESRFNPFAESPMGAKGLMQVMSDVHQARFEDFGGIHAALNPVANIKVGTSILKEYISRTGSISGGLKMYVGATDMQTDGGYGVKVLSEYVHLKSVADGKAVSIYTKELVKNPHATLASLDQKTQLIASNDSAL